MAAVEPAIFWLLALVLVLLAIAFVILPSLYHRIRETSDASRNAQNVSIFQQRSDELEQSLEDDEISQDEFDALKQELEGTLLEEVDETQEPVAVITSAGKLPLYTAFFVPLLAIGLYADWGFSLGSLSDLAFTAKLRNFDGKSQDSAALASEFQEVMARQPDNLEGQYLLGQTLLNVGKYSEAASTFQSLLGQFPGDGNLNGAYAEALFLADGRRVTARVREAVDRALSINPHQIPLLEMLGMAAYSSGDKVAAVSYFRRALSSGPTGRQATVLQQVVARLESETAGLAPAATASEESPVVTDTESDQRSIAVRVEVSDAVPLSGDETIFIFARAAQGPPMPLAVQRVKASDLPVSVILNEQMAMMPDMSLATFDQVQVGARVSRTGAVDQDSPYSAISAPVDLTSGAVSVELLIDG